MIRSVNDIRTWPPGALMGYDNTSLNVHFPRDKRGLGLVVANDGSGAIHVLWDASCSRAYVRYEVSALNASVIYRAG